MNEIIHLKDENVKIKVLTTNDMEEKYRISIEGAIKKCIKHVYRYGEFFMPKDIMIKILWLAFKGHGCKKDHFDISQRLSIYEYLKDKEVDNPYIKQFLKETKENFKNAAI